jgi:membrane fusion protein (multidrug efflux system)
VVNEYVGRIAAYRSVEVRARVQGIVERRVFTEGTDVRKGDLLYVIEPLEYQKAVDNAKASLARAQADLGNARAKEARLAPLVKEEAISRQDYDDALTAVKQQEAAVAAARATLDRAEIDLGYTNVYATESGRIGQTLVPEGRLVGKDGPTQLATIDKIDPAYVVFTLSDRDALVLRRAIIEGRIRLAGPMADRLRRDIAEGKSGDSQSRGPSVRVILPDGIDYAQGGRIDFADTQVNSETGTITMRAVLPNPERTLLPGMFVRVELTVGTRPGAIVVPQQAVVKTPTGHTVWVVGKDMKAERRDVVVGPWYRSDWVIDKGLGAGEIVVVDGVQKVQVGSTVRASPFVEQPAAAPSQPAATSKGAAPAAK